MQDSDTLVEALGALSLALWLTTWAFRMETPSRRRIQIGAFLVFGLALMIAIFRSAVYFWR